MRSRSATFVALIAGAYTVIGAVPNQRILVRGFNFIAPSDLTVTLQDEDGGVLAGPYPVSQSIGIALHDCEAGYALAPVGKAVQVAISDAPVLPFAVQIQYEIVR